MTAPKYICIRDSDHQSSPGLCGCGLSAQVSLSLVESAPYWHVCRRGSMRQPHYLELCLIGPIHTLLIALTRVCGPGLLETAHAPATLCGARASLLLVYAQAKRLSKDVYVQSDFLLGERRDAVKTNTVLTIAVSSTCQPLPQKLTQVSYWSQASKTSDVPAIHSLCTQSHRLFSRETRRYQRLTEQTPIPCSN